MVGKDDKQSAGPQIGRYDKQNADDMDGCLSSGQRLSRMEGHSLAPVACEQVYTALAGAGYTVLLSSLTCGNVPPRVGHLCQTLEYLPLCLEVLSIFGVLRVCGSQCLRCACVPFLYLPMSVPYFLSFCT